MNRLSVALLFVGLWLGNGCTSVPTSLPIPPPPAPVAAVPPAKIFAEITTPRGVIRCELFFQQAPLTVMNFVGLAEGTLGPSPRKPYFDGIVFHRIVPEFVIQGGDPTGTGRGGPGYTFPDEFAAGLRHDVPGLLSMANSGPDTNGSQFFITLGEARYLDYVHSIFGRVVEGHEVLTKITRNDTMEVNIIREGEAAENFRADDEAFNAALAAASRAKPPHLIDRTTGNPPGDYWQSKYIEYRLGNLARFTGRHIYVRLFDTFDPNEPEQTRDQFAQDLLAKLHGPPGTLLAVHFADEEAWVLAGAPLNLALPELKPPPPPRAPVTSTDALARQRQTRIYHATGQMISSLVDQTDPE